MKLEQTAVGVRMHHALNTSNKRLLLNFNCPRDPSSSEIVYNSGWNIRHGLGEANV